LKRMDRSGYVHASGHIDLIAAVNAASCPLRSLARDRHIAVMRQR
jgi:hypothetical protein